MDTGRPKTLHYKRSHFATQLPVDYFYTPSHAWVAPCGENCWRVGLTRFATRMLGEMVDHGFEVKEKDRVETGEIVGWVEGFKAISDLFCVVSGTFRGGNPALRENVKLVSKDPYGEGWLYAVEGVCDANCIGVEAYRNHLDKTIDRMLEKQKSEAADESS